MRPHPQAPTRIRAIVALAAILGLAAILVLAQGIGTARLAAQAPAALEATIFSFDGQDFVRTKTTLRTEAGQSAAGTKLDRNSAAYKALSQKHSYSGQATAFGKTYDANYAPLTDASGKLTGALFVGVPK
ncbi:MAG TPA: Cache 3/Cache 2 fusion domain-containing protein [Gemmatimonadaceae bacterium]|nr:Cache 3/Cache 2 fusion domain-containing protein [Gemmatimonadaceae bacterium]